MKGPLIFEIIGAICQLCTPYGPPCPTLVFEIIGAMGEETQKWWKSIVEMGADQRMPEAPQS